MSSVNCFKVGKFSFEVKAAFTFSDFHSKHSFLFFLLLTSIFKAPISIVAIHKNKLKNPPKNSTKGFQLIICCYRLWNVDYHCFSKAAYCSVNY